MALGWRIDDFQWYTVSHCPAPVTWELIICIHRAQAGQVEGHRHNNVRDWYLNRLYSILLGAALSWTEHASSNMSFIDTWILVPSETDQILYTGDLIRTSPFVTRWSHHFHTFLSDLSEELAGVGCCCWSYLIWAAMGTRMTRYVNMDTSLSRGRIQGLVRPIWIITLITRLSLTKQTISKSNSISQIRLFHSSVTRLLSRNIAGISHEKFSFLFYIST